MNRDFVFNHDDERRPGAWTRAGVTLNRWFWGALCCGLPGVPCFFCSCFQRYDDGRVMLRPAVNQATGTTERIRRPHRPHTPHNGKVSPGIRDAVREALSQLQGEPAPYKPPVTVMSAETNSIADDDMNELG